MAKGPPSPAATLRGQRWRRCDGGELDGASLPLYFRAVGRAAQLEEAARAKVGQRVQLRLAFGTVTYTREA